MGKSVPMLSDSKQLKVWEQLEEVSGAKRRKSAESAFRRILETVRDMPGPDGVLVQFLAEVASECFPETFKDVVLSLEEKITEDSPDAVLHISDLLLDAGDITYAESFMAKAGDRGDRELSCRVHGKMEIHQGRTDDAVYDLIGAWSLNPTDPDTYSLLERLEPDYGWQYIRCMESMWADGELPSPGADVPCAYAELYDCCVAWNSGRRTDAMGALQSSERFTSDSYFQVTYARMSLVTGLYSRALDAYRTALAMSPGYVFAMSEAASAMRLSGDYQDAIDMCRTALERYPGCRTAFEQMIQAAADSGRKHETDGYISRYLLLQPEDATAYAFCASVLHSSGFPMEATNLVKRMEPRCTDRAYANLQMSVDVARNGEWKKAVTYANRAKKSDKGSIECMCQSARAYLGVNNIKLAEREAAAALEAAPNSIAAMSVMKDVHAAKGENDAALSMLDSIISLVPRNASFRKDRADLLAEMGRYEESLDGYRESLNIRDDVRLFISVLRKMLKDRKIRELCRFVDDYDDSYGDSAEVWMIRGNGEYLSGMYNEAASSYARACSLSCNDPVIWHSRGMAEQMAGDLHASQASFDRAIILDLENPEYWLSKALVQEEAHDISGAVLSINKVINLTPDQVFPLVVKARLMAALRMYNEALFFLDLALHISPSDLRLYSMKKDIYMHVGMYDEAEGICNTMLQIDRENLQVMVDRAMAVLCAGRPEEANIMMNDLRNKYRAEYEVMRGEARFRVKMTEYDKAADVYENLLVSYPDDTQSAEELVALYRSMGMDREAAEWDRKLHPDREEPASVPFIVDDDPDDPDDGIPDAGTEVPCPSGSEQEEHDEGTVEEQLEELMDRDMSSSEPFLMYIDIMLSKGDVDAALKTAEKARSLFSSDTVVLSTLGDVYARTGDTLAALASYTDAAELGMSTPELYLKKGNAEYELNLYQRAIESYSAVVRADPTDRDALIGISRVHMRIGQKDQAAPLLDSVLTRDPGDTEALKMRTEIFVDHNDSEGLLSLYPFIERSVTDPADLQYFADALRNVGEEEKARSLFGPAVYAGASVTPAEEHRPEPAPAVREPLVEEDGSMGHMEHTDGEIEAMAADVLKRSEETGYGADDPRLYQGLDSWDAEAVRRFFRTAQGYPFINPGDSFFEELESLSHGIIVGEGLTGIDSDPVVSLEIVYRHCREKDLDSVRRMQAYINYALTDDGDPIPFSREVEELAAKPGTGGMSVFGIMKGYGIGVYSAVTVKKLSGQ